MLKDENKKQLNFKTNDIKKPKSNWTNFQKLWLRSWDCDNPIKIKHEKNHEAKFSIIQKFKIKKPKQILIKRMRTKSDIKIKWNEIMRDEIKK